MASPLKIKVDVLEKDFGMKHLREELAKLSKVPYVKVGVQGKKALEKKLDSEKNPQPFDVVQIAAAHEFGTDRVPERSFIRKTINENQQKYATLAQNLLDRVLTPSLKFKTEKALGLLGQAAVADIQNTIRNDNTGLDGPTPLAPSTIRGPDATPLYDTGQLIRSNTYKVEMNGGGKPGKDIMDGFAERLKDEAEI